MAMLDSLTRRVLTVAAGAAAVLSWQAVRAEQQPPPLPPTVPLSSLTAQGFDVKAVAGTQAGVAGTLVLQKGKDVYLCTSRGLTYAPTTFECWSIK